MVLKAGSEKIKSECFAVKRLNFKNFPDKIGNGLEKSGLIDYIQ